MDSDLFRGCFLAVWIALVCVFLAGVAVGAWVLPWIVEHLVLQVR